MADISLKDRAAIAGIGESRFAKRLEASEKQLACEVIVAALDDAGIEPSEVDGLCSYTMEVTDEIEVAKSIGAGDLTYFTRVGFGGGGGCATVANAAMAVATGQAQVVVAWRSRKRGSGPRPWSQDHQLLEIPSQWSRPWGLLRPADEVAMVMRRYMHEFGATRDHLANIAVAVRKHANNNPNAIMYERTLTRAVHGRSLDQRAVVPVRQLSRDRRRVGVRRRLGRARQ